MTFTSTEQDETRPSEEFEEEYSSGLVNRLLLLGDCFLPEEAFEDADLKRRGRLLIATGLGFGFVSFFFGTLLMVSGGYPLHSILILFVGGALVLSNLPLLRWMGSTIVPGTLICLESLLIIALQAYFDTGLYDSSLLWTLLVPWLAAFLVGPKIGFVFAGVVSAITWWFYRLEIQGHPFPYYSTMEEAWLFYLLCMIGVAFFIGFLGWVYEGQTLRHLRETNDSLRKTRDALQESNRRIVSILESITDGFFALDDAWRFTYVNRQAEELLGRSRVELLEHNALDLFGDSEDAGFVEYLQEAVEAEEAVEGQLFYEPLGSWLELHVYPYRGGLTVYFNDITARKEYEQQLVEARRDAEALARLKSELLTNMSHEIRTPLTAILGFARILADESEGTHQEFGQIIEQNGNRLLTTLNSVLDLAQLESGDVDGDSAVIDLTERLEQAEQLFRPNAREKGLYLHVESDVEDAHIEGDAGFVDRVLSNLVGNAIKFTEEGGVTLRLRSEGEVICLQVVDTGQGISEDFLPHVFEEFRQESTGLSRTHEGNGLGLAISRRLVEVMGGTIEVESTKGEGSVFTVAFPRYESVEPVA